MWSVKFNKKEKLLVLLDYDADVNIKDDKGIYDLRILNEIHSLND